MTLALRRRGVSVPRSGTRYGSPYWTYLGDGIAVNLRVYEIHSRPRRSDRMDDRPITPKLVVVWGRYLPCTFRYAQVPGKFDVEHVAERVAQYYRTEQRRRQEEEVRKGRVKEMDGIAEQLERRVGLVLDEQVDIGSDHQGTGLDIHLRHLSHAQATAILQTYASMKSGRI